MHRRHSTRRIITCFLSSAPVVTGMFGEQAPPVSIALTVTQRRLLNGFRCRSLAAAVSRLRPALASCSVAAPDEAPLLSRSSLPYATIVVPQRRMHLGMLASARWRHRYAHPTGTPHHPAPVRLGGCAGGQNNGICRRGSCFPGTHTNSCLQKRIDDANMQHRPLNVNSTMPDLASEVNLCLSPTRAHTHTPHPDVVRSYPEDAGCRIDRLHWSAGLLRTAAPNPPTRLKSCRDRH